MRKEKRKSMLIKELEEYRLENKIPMEKLAKMLDVPFLTVYRWFNGMTKPNQIHTYHIKKFLEKSK